MAQALKFPLKVRELATTSLLVFVGACGLAAGARADAVTDWNLIALNTIPPIHGLGPMGSRAMGYVHAAIFDAVNAVERKYSVYKVDITAPDASAGAAAMTAGHGMLVKLYPEQQIALDAALAKSLKSVAEGKAKEDGVALGRQVAEKIDVVTDDFGAVDPSYKLGTDPSSWQPYPASALPRGQTWGSIKPFLMTKPDQFTLPGPLSVRSAEYAKELEEVRVLGGRDSPERTTGQTAIAIFWTVGGAPVLNEIARKEALARGLDLAANARLFALINMAMSDAGIATWHEKFRYNFLRPVTAIRNAAALDNPAIKQDAAWEPLIVTPSHPDYPSGHCANTGAGATILRKFFGTDAIQSNATYTYPMLGVTRQWTNYTALVKETGNARIWGGIHTRTADEHADMLGRQVAEYVFDNFLRPK
jgi:hypothetical protein